MFRKVKFILVCAVLAMGATACGTDNDSDPKPILKSEVYDISVEITDDVYLKTIAVNKSSSTKVSTDYLLNTENDIPVVVDPTAPLPEKTKKWTKSYSKTSAELISVLVEGTAENAGEYALIIIAKEGDTIVNKRSSGEKILLDVGI
ncbi:MULTISPECIES: hypothetical protein [unclassified Myroides]|uniref:hypothetical protein n=1 Tax=unclassified Myroides TaxID=2642485 RepID=UPI003D2F8507